MRWTSCHRGIGLQHRRIERQPAHVAAAVRVPVDPLDSGVNRREIGLELADIAACALGNSRHRRIVSDRALRSEIVSDEGIERCFGSRDLSRIRQLGATLHFR